MIQNEWRFSLASVVGSSHSINNKFCQDASACEVILDFDDLPVLIAITSDGSGSALFAECGSQLACDTLIEIAIGFLHKSKVVAISEEIVKSWINKVNEKIEALAVLKNTKTSEFACTMLMAIIGSEHALFTQIGDGAIVIGAEMSLGGYDWVFWPDNGEYANETTFLTDRLALEKLRYQALKCKFDEVALFTDGIQRLVLDYKNHSVHCPFFKNMFTSFTGEKTGRITEFDVALEKYLSSSKINSLTSDDKTLIIATRKVLKLKDRHPESTPSEQISPDTSKISEKYI